MKAYCVKCRKHTENLNSNIKIKKKEAKELLSNIGIKTPLSKIPLLNVLF